MVLGFVYLGRLNGDLWLVGARPRPCGLDVMIFLVGFGAQRDLKGPLVVAIARWSSK